MRSLFSRFPRLGGCLTAILTQYGLRRYLKNWNSNWKIRKHAGVQIINRIANTYWLYFLCEALICMAISYPLSLPSSTTTSLPPSLSCHSKYCSYSQVPFSGFSYFEPRSLHSLHLIPGIRMVNQEALATHTINSGNTSTPLRFQPQKLHPCRTQLLEVHSLRAQCHQVSGKVTIWGRFMERWQREIASSTVVLWDVYSRFTARHVKSVISFSWSGWEKTRKG